MTMLLTHTWTQGRFLEPHKTKPNTIANVLSDVIEHLTDTSFSHAIFGSSINTRWPNASVSDHISADPDEALGASYDIQYYIDLLEEYMPTRTSTDYGKIVGIASAAIPAVVWLLPRNAAHDKWCLNTVR